MSLPLHRFAFPRTGYPAPIQPDPALYLPILNSAGEYRKHDECSKGAPTKWPGRDLNSPVFIVGFPLSRAKTDRVKIALTGA